MIALCSEGVSTIRNPLQSDDTRAGIEAARVLGCAVEEADECVTIRGIGRERPVSQAEIDVRSAGTIARFLPCILSLGAAGSWTLTASEQMKSRPMKGVFDALARLAPDSIRSLGRPGYLPVAVQGGCLAAAETNVSGSISSQYLSGLLLAAPQADRPLSFVTDGHIVQRQYVDITIDCMRAAGANVEAAPDLSRIVVEPTGYVARDISVEADASTASYFSALPAALGGSITIPNLSRNSLQPDIRFIEILQKLGCKVDWLGAKEVRISRPGDLPKLRGNQHFDLNDCSDIALTVAALSPFADGPILITGVEHIRNHECDRVDAMTVALRRTGIEVTERPDGWAIQPGQPRFADLETRDDHRMAMALTVLGLAGSGVSLDHPNCVGKTCPRFFDLVRDVGAVVTRVPTE
ncbi:3-phosphoshikimate 1-carboxyvinyltransferase [Paracoccus sulfuroxidans]|uniref:3-phosphoshikimate 1-carboxyvinyltransferase n=2 Tax=Paracoccus sulfuroxidans TaxID=384678 RepID=A0A562NFT6_9RHOB|nr:3-phosphoshikimate 1-carboxyvinyltransferase [Paracoccus sulfuroxidans]